MNASIIWIVAAVVLIIAGLAHLLVRSEARERHKLLVTKFHEECQRFETYKGFLRPSSRARMNRRLGNADVLLAQRPFRRRLDEAAADLRDVTNTIERLSIMLKERQERDDRTDEAFRA